MIKKKIILAIGDWNKKIYDQNKKNFKNYLLISDRNKLNISLNKYQIEEIFIIHWHYKIPKRIILKYKCISFHMTKLPYGRGGSPLQNLIIRNHKETYLSVFKTSFNFDSGDIFIQKKMSLKGSALQILTRCSKMCFRIIKRFEQNKLISKPQKGKIVNFKRISKKSSQINFNKNIKSIYDNIRMLDAPIYSKANLKIKNKIIEFKDSKLINDKIYAKIVIKNEF